MVAILIVVCIVFIFTYFLINYYSNKSNLFVIKLITFICWNLGFLNIILIPFDIAQN